MVENERNMDKEGVGNILNSNLLNSFDANKLPFKYLKQKGYVSTKYFDARKLPFEYLKQKGYLVQFKI